MGRFGTRFSYFKGCSI
ncbi:hypothetical protein LINGRAHAP2_LOCUS20519 [Linum grandiflorum]